jgi:hypothetical protein
MLLPELAARHRVDAGGGLVEEQQRRRVHGGAGERQALLPARRRACRRAATAGACEPCARAPRRPGPAPRAAPRRCPRRTQVLAHAEVLVQAEALGHVADARPWALGLRGCRSRRTVAARRAGVEDAAQHADGGGLAGAVGAEDAEDLAALDGEAHVAHRHELAEARDRCSAQSRPGSRLDAPMPSGDAHGRHARRCSTNAGTPARRRCSGSWTRTPHPHHQVGALAAR